MQGLIIITIMEKDKKIQLLLDVQEHPELFSEQALQSMLDDPEVRELMEATALLKHAMISEEVTVKPYFHFSLLTFHLIKRWPPPSSAC